MAADPNPVVSPKATAEGFDLVTGKGIDYLNEFKDLSLSPTRPTTGDKGE